MNVINVTDNYDRITSSNYADILNQYDNIRSNNYTSF